MSEEKKDRDIKDYLNDILEKIADIAGFLGEVPAHGVAGVMGRMALDAGQAADLVEHRMEKPRSAILKSF